MAVNIYSIRDSIKNLMDKNNTSTSGYYISSGLDIPIQAIYAGYAKAPIPNILYPCIFVELKNKTREFGQLGRSSNRKNEIKFDIVSINQSGFGQIPGRDVSDQQMIKITDKLETLFDNYPTLSNTCEQCLITDVDYDIEFSNDTYNSVSRISLLVTKFSS